MFADIFKEFIDGTKQFFEENPTYFLVVLIAFILLISSVVAYIVISNVDFDKTRKEKKEKAYIRTVLHEDEEGLFSRKINISCEKIVRKSRKKE